MSSSSKNSDRNHVLSVSRLSWLIRQAIENEIGNVWVEGEISSATRAQSGHVYLTLKDPKSQIRGIIWRSTLERLRVELEPGQKVLCRGTVEVYAPRGEYQLVIDRVEQTGLGGLQLAFRKLHQRLHEEGLFRAEFKKQLPRIPRHLAVVTSPAGAAIHDFLKVLLRRWPFVRITIIPVPVQGPDAKTEIARAILAANRARLDFDALVVTRGGGSLEDLWAFNEEVVVRAIFESEIPVLSAVGHETDVTLADLVADHRAATPSEAAETIAPDFHAVNQTVNDLRGRLAAGLQRLAQVRRNQLKLLADNRVFRKPLEICHVRGRACDDLAERISRLAKRTTETNRNRLENLARGLESVSPLQVLSRGYSITQDDEKKTIRSVDQISEGDRIHTQLPDGQFESEVCRVERSSNQ